MYFWGSWKSINVILNILQIFVRNAINDALTKLKSAHESKDLALIDAGMEELNKAWEGAAQEMYAASQAQEAQPTAEEPTADAGSSEGSRDTQTPKGKSGATS